MENKRHYLSFKNSIGKIGVGVKFGKGVKISGYDNIKIGNNVHIGSGCFIKGEGGLKIGDNVIVSRNVVIYTNSHNYKGDLLPFDNTFVNKPVEINRNAWIGMNTTISPGTVIGEGAIIALGTRVFGEIPKLSVVGGSQPIIIKQRDVEHYRALVSRSMYAKEDGRKLSNQEDGK